MLDHRVERAVVRGIGFAFVHEGRGGYPLLLVHGWPETKRIWWRNIRPLVDAGFEVIVPDLRGFGDSGLAPDGFYDPAAHAEDLHALVHDVLGHPRCSIVAGDLGGVVAQDLALRRAGFVERLVLLNTLLPILPTEYAAAGIVDESQETRVAADYFLRQGRDADALAAELDTPEKRRRYIATFYGSRFWAAPGTFTRDDVEFMTEPFADGDKLRAGFGNYETAFGARPTSGPVRFFERIDVPSVVLVGPEDHVIDTDLFMAKARVAFTHLVGPLVAPGAGHFLQWEQSDVLNGVVAAFLRDRLPVAR